MPYRVKKNFFAFLDELGNFKHFETYFFFWRFLCQKIAKLGKSKELRGVWAHQLQKMGLETSQIRKKSWFRVVTISISRHCLRFLSILLSYGFDYITYLHFHKMWANTIIYVWYKESVIPSWKYLLTMYKYFIHFFY